MEEASRPPGAALTDRALIYRDLAVAAWQDGTLTRDERRLLDVARQRLKLSEDEAGRIEMAVYRQALEEVLAAVSPDRRDHLERLRESLAITQGQHKVLLHVLQLARGHGGVPTDLGGFAVERELGRGGYGRALLAKDVHLQRRVVLKEPLSLVGGDEEALEVFLREARISAQLQHPNVVAVHQVIVDADPPVLVMEHVDGESLADRLRRGTLAPDETTRLAADTLAGLRCIHEAGIVHRDLKPGNILLAADGTAKVTDFGIAHAADPALARALDAGGWDAGSPLYMSPEQFAGKAVDVRSDLYSLGVVLHEAFTGVPYLDPEADDYRTWFRPDRKEAGVVPDAWAPVLEKALAREPGVRWASAEEMAATLPGST